MHHDGSKEYIQKDQQIGAGQDHDGLREYCYHRISQYCQALHITTNC